MEFDASPLWISIKTAAVSTFITFFCGMFAAKLTAARKGKLKGIIDGIFMLPLVLPPTVVGFFLLLLFGRNGPAGRFLMKLGLTAIFSWPATVIAATVVAFPLMYKTARAAFEQIDANILDVARTLGISRWKSFWKISLPLALPGVVAGGILSFVRALGEFGATIMVAGNIPGKTQTIPVAIYFAVEGGEMDKAVIWVVLIVSISFISVFLMNFWLEHQGRFAKMLGRK